MVVTQTESSVRKKSSPLNRMFISFWFTSLKPVSIISILRDPVKHAGEAASLWMSVEGEGGFVCAYFEPQLGHQLF
jgi:hypothetical protein